MAFQAREAKRARRGKNRRLRAVVENPIRKKLTAVKKKSMKLSDIPAVETTSNIRKKKPTGKKSTFTSALTAIGKKSVKKARHGPEDSEFQKARVAYRLKTKKKL
ncbi:hypothetical protein OESDEN_20462 [Oesophagostomum dentatum]|uniref:Uncharacterized protein n=1 Tax=Oesophagostomum dentatum TaxID=61180 RepID=A0A0B1S8L1_OESDE|nr:hypothetical protein OESDEN_20462 [Oesophagostomum dentatum]